MGCQGLVGHTTYVCMYVWAESAPVITEQREQRFQDRSELLVEPITGMGE